MSDDTTLEPLKFQDQMHQMQHEMFVKLITDRNDLVGRANAANGDRVTLTEQIRESSDPEIAALREKWSQAYLDLMAVVEPKVDAIINDQAGSTEGIENEIAELDKTLKPGLTFYKKVYGDEAAKHLPSQERLKGATVRSASGGGRRVRGFNVIVTIDGESEEFENFSKAAQYLDVSTGDLQSEFFKHAGTSTLKDIGNEVSFTLSVEDTDEDGNTESKDAFVKAYRTEAVAESNDSAPAEVEDEPVEDVDLENL